MAYTIIDLLEKFVKIEERGYELFCVLAGMSETDKTVQTLARVFAKEEERHINLYKKMIEEMKNVQESEIEIDFGIYDKAAKLIYEFSGSRMQMETMDRKSLLHSCLNFEKENLALALSIQGLLVKSQADMGSKSYQVLSLLIKEEQKHVKSIENFLR